MRILVLSDLHANATALETALTAANGRWDRVVCLGDVVGYGPDPNEVTSKIRELDAQTIRGNHDKAATGLMPTDDFNPVAKAAVDWTRSQLSPENLKWLAELPHGPLEVSGIVLVHGALQDEHTHHQGGFSYSNTSNNLEMLNLRPRPSESVSALRTAGGLRYLLNPGSIGQPRDGDARAGFAIADLEHEIVEFWRVPYEIAAVQSRMRAARLPEALAQRLSLGR